MASPFEKVPAEKLHYIYAVNCFQHAIGYETPIFARRSAAGREFVFYERLQPGSIFNSDLSKETMIEEFQRKMLGCCEEENILPCGNTPVLKEGYRTLALYTGAVKGQMDCHFAFFNKRGLWESKTPFQEPMVHKTVLAAGLGYDFCSYLLAPENLLPKAVSEWTPKAVHVTTLSGKTIKLQEIADDSPGQYGNSLIFEPAQHVAFLIEAKKLLPLPPWPPRSLPVLMARPKAQPA